MRDKEFELMAEAHMKAMRPREIGREGIMRACLDLLEAERILHFRMNAGDRIVPGKSNKRYRIKGHDKGTADILFFIGAQPVWCECKRPGEGLTGEQPFFRIDVMQRGHWYVIVDDPTQLQDFLKEHK
jgi:hypothetical protein